MTAAAAALPTLAERATRLRGLGWTKREAEWLALVCLHSGLFTRRQYAARYGISRQTADRFARGLVATGLAREAPMRDPRAYRPTGICHVHARALYRALGIENNRHRKRASREITMRRLLSLDYVLEHPELAWLPTEPEKLAYFQRIGIPVTSLPSRVYAGPFAARSVRYFVVKLPIAGNGATTVFVYAATGGRNPLQTVQTWAGAHVALWEALRQRGGAVHVVAVARAAKDAAANAAILETWRGPATPAVPLSTADRQLLDAIKLADSIGDPSLLTRYGGPIEAAKAARCIQDREQAARGPSKCIDAYSTHVAERLVADVSAF